MTDSTPANMNRISVVCPAYFDELNIGPLVDRCEQVLGALCSEFEIILVEDGSPDATGRVADELAATHSCVVALHHPRNMGHGAALKTGIRAARFPVVAIMDGDGQCDPADLPAFIALLDRFDLIQGSRSIYPNSRFRAFLSRAYNAFVLLAFGTPFHDLGCSYKVFKKEIVEKSWPTSSGIFMQGEFAIRAWRSGFRVGELEIKSYPRMHGRSSSLKLKNVSRMAVDFLRLRAVLRRNGKPKC